MREFRCLIILSMISVSLLNVAMLFTYRLIEVGPFLVPGGVIVFSMTYVFADIIAEVYGYKYARMLVWGNFVCIFVFNCAAHSLLLLPVSPLTHFESAYHEIFSHSFSIIVGYSAGFLFGDLINAYAVSRLGVLYRGKYFALRSIASSVVGQSIFSVVVSLTIYSSQLTGTILFRQFSTTIGAKVLIIMLLAYPSTLVVNAIRRFEGIKAPYQFGNFNSVQNAI